MISPSVLVCDDEPNLRELIRVSLGPGWAVHEATDGEEALTMARSLQPDLVVLDLMMPRLNGLDVLSRLKSDPALGRTRFLVVTAQPASEVEAREHGADGIIVKPFAPEDLAELAATLVSVR
jgi:CheY-like chemotaxis protein